MLSKPKKHKISIKEITLFGLLGAVLYLSKILLDVLPNIHLIGMFIVGFTVLYRSKALYPIYVFVFLTGLLNGFSVWWIPYLYIWTVLWGAVMLLPKFKSKKAAAICYMTVCALHGFLYGTLYAPFQAIAFGLDFKGMIAWIAAGFPFDIIHGISNFIAGALILPMVAVLKKADKYVQ